MVPWWQPQKFHSSQVLRPIPGTAGTPTNWWFGSMFLLFFLVSVFSGSSRLRLTVRFGNSEGCLFRHFPRGRQNYDGLLVPSGHLLQLVPAFELGFLGRRRATPSYATLGWPDKMEPWRPENPQRVGHHVSNVTPDRVTVDGTTRLSPRRVEAS